MDCVEIKVCMGILWDNRGMNNLWHWFLMKQRGKYRWKVLASLCDRSYSRMKSMEDLISLLAAPIWAVKVPGSAIHWWDWVSKKLRASLLMVNCTVLVSPGAKWIFWNPFSSFSGRSTEHFLSEIYSWTTYAPAHLPVLVTSMLKVISLSVVMIFLLAVALPKRKVV